jgi:23S rRNA C2498 (ribose-2'-O)-methylase RlmM
MKFAEMAMVQIVDSVEDENSFSMLACMKSHHCYKLITHLPFVVLMFTEQFYILQNFMYA